MTTTVRARRRPSERRRPTRRRYLARRWTAMLIVLAVLGLAYIVLFTPLVGVHTINVSGTTKISQNEVREAAAIEPGTPMARLDTGEVARRVAELPRVFDVQVSRSWPTTVEIAVTEREPVAVLASPDGLHLIDGTGLDYATVDSRPPGLPTLRVDNPTPDDPATRAAVTVIEALPAQLRKRVVEVSAQTPGNIRLTLANKRVIKWGNAEDNERKAAVLAPLLTRPGRTYDVATPDFPTVS
jgi:cell division protein FtsQ